MKSARGIRALREREDKKYHGKKRLWKKKAPPEGNWIESFLSILLFISAFSPSLSLSLSLSFVLMYNSATGRKVIGIIVYATL